MTSVAPRARWIDVTRGFAILFVVMHHAGSYERALFAIEIDGLADVWLGMELLLYHLRLPLFFFISGILGSGHFSRDGAPRAAAALKLLRVYALWAVILLFLAPRWPVDGIDLTPSLAAFPPLLWGGSVAWYLWAIALCFGFAHLTGRLPLLVLAIVIRGVDLFTQYALGWFGSSVASWARCLPLYMLGFRLPALGGHIVAIHGFRRVTFPLILYFSALGGSSVLLIPDFLLDLGGVVVGLLSVGLVTRRWPLVVDAVEWVGLRTLPIYLLHFPIIAALGCWAIRLWAPLTPGHPATLLFVPALAVASVMLSLLLNALIVRSGGRWLFSPPSIVSLWRRRATPSVANPPVARDLPMDGETT